jgi:hypothetical protein
MVQYIEIIFLSLRTQRCYEESEEWNVLILQTVASCPPFYVNKHVFIDRQSNTTYNCCRCDTEMIKQSKQVENKLNFD